MTRRWPSGATEVAPRGVTPRRARSRARAASAQNPPQIPRAIPTTSEAVRRDRGRAAKRPRAPRAPKCPGAACRREKIADRRRSRPRPGARGALPEPPRTWSAAVRRDRSRAEGQGAPPSSGALAAVRSSPPGAVRDRRRQNPGPEGRRDRVRPPSGADGAAPRRNAASEGSRSDGRLVVEVSQGQSGPGTREKRGPTAGRGAGPVGPNRRARKEGQTPEGNTRGRRPEERARKRETAQG